MDGPSNSGYHLNSVEVQSYLIDHLNVADGTAPTSCVYHYTPADVLEKFLADDGDLLCTHCRSLNDSEEFLVGAGLFIDYMKARAWNQDLIARVTKQINGFAHYDLSMPWIFSFSWYNDSLPQWSVYTDKRDGGYAIGFSVDKLIKLGTIRSDKANMDNHYPVTTYYHPCIYVGIDDVFAEFDSFFQGHINSGDVHSARIDDHLVNEVVGMALMMAAVVKDRSFYMEGESRLVISANFDEAYKRIKSIGGRARMPAFVKEDIGLLRDMIRSVIISPHGKRDSLFVNALNLKRKHNANFVIKFSPSPYRG